MRPPGGARGRGERAARAAPSGGGPAGGATAPGARWRPAALGGETPFSSSSPATAASGPGSDRRTRSGRAGVVLRGPGGGRQRERSVKIKLKLKKTYLENKNNTILKIKDLAAKSNDLAAKLNLECFSCASPHHSPRQGLYNESTK